MKARGSKALALVFLLAFGCKSNPNDHPSDREVEGARLVEEGRYREGLEAFRQSIQEGRASYLSLIGMAVAHVNLGDTALFEAFAVEASRAAPPGAQAWRRLGLMYLRGAERRRDRAGGERYARLAVEYLKRVFADRDGNDDPHLLYHLGLSLVLCGDSEAAVVLLEEEIKRTPNRSDCLHILIAAHRELGHRERVRELIEIGVKIDARPETWESYRRWVDGGPIPGTPPTSAPSEP